MKCQYLQSTDNEENIPHTIPPKSIHSVLHKIIDIFNEEPLFQ